MRVYQFITLFLALGVACGCSHRRAQQQPVAASLCDCATCRCEQEQMIISGAVPAERFEYIATPAVPATAVPDSGASMAKPAAPKSNELSPVYASDPGNEVVSESPFSSGNPIEMDEAPQQFNIPNVDKIESLPNQVPSDTLKLTPEPGGLPTLGQNRTESSSKTKNAFKPFDRDIFKVKSEASTPLPPEQQPSILINKVSEASQPDLGAIAPPSTSQFQLSLSEPSSNDFSIPDEIASASAAIEPEQPAVVEPEITTPEPPANVYEPVARVAMPDFASNSRKVVPEPFQPTETVVEGELYEDPIVLYARPRHRQLNPRPAQTPRVAQAPRPAQTPRVAQTPRAVQTASVQRPVRHQSIAQVSQLDPVYGLPLSNQVQFNSLPVVAAPQPAPAAPEAQHLHVHIHHEYGGNPGVVQGPVAYQNGQPASNVQVVYRDDKGRVIMAPPTPTSGVAVPTGDQRTYYIPPKPILRLKAVSPIDQPRSNPSVASIQMRDTVVHGGSHLLTQPEYQAQAVHTNHGLPGIDHEKLREAFRPSPSGNSLR